MIIILQIFYETQTFMIKATVVMLKENIWFMSINIVEGYNF